MCSVYHIDISNWISLSKLLCNRKETKKKERIFNYYYSCYILAYTFYLLWFFITMDCNLMRRHQIKVNWLVDWQNWPAHNAVWSQDSSVLLNVRHNTQILLSNHEQMRTLCLVGVMDGGHTTHLHQLLLSQNKTPLPTQSNRLIHTPATVRHANMSTHWVNSTSLIIN